MATFTKLTNGNVIYENDHGPRTGLSGNLNVLPHPSDINGVILTDSANSKTLSESFLFDWRIVTSPSGATNRNELITLLSTDIFSSAGSVYLTDPDSNVIDVQNPLPADGDSVYVKDVDQLNSSNGGFSGSVTDYFDSLKTVNVNSSGDAVKSIKIWFNRTIQTHAIGFGCDDLTKNFSNIVIKALGSGEVVRYTKDLSSDSTKKNSQVIELPLLQANGFIFEFHTTDEVALSNLIIFKSIDTHTTISATDPDGEVIDIGATSSGNLKTTDAENGLAIAKGEVIGTTFIHKFGAAIDFDVADGFVTVWDGSDSASISQFEYQYSSVADIDSIVSEDSGATQLMEIQGLDANYNLVVQNATLNGQTRVALTTPLIRVFRVKNISNQNLGDHCYVYVDTPIVGGVPTDTTKVRAMVHAENNQTEMAVFTIPAGKNGYMRDWYASTAGARRDSSHTIRLLARPFNQVFQLKHTGNIDVTGTTYVKHDYNEPEVFSEKTDIEIKMNTSQDIAGVAAGFDIVLIDN